MLFKPLLGTDLSGKVGGVVASHNAGGAYFRAATIPTNPNTPQQQAVRNAVSLLASFWESSLTQGQRDGWDVYASNTKLINRIGEQMNVSGLAMFIRSNTARLQVGIARIDDAPSVYNLGNKSANGMSNATEAGQTVDVSFGATLLGDPWANEAGGFLLVYLSRPQNAGITYFRGPYRYAAGVTGDPVPPVSPATVAAPFAFVAGQRLFGRAVACYADGRYTHSTFMTTLAVA